MFGNKKNVITITFIVVLVCTTASGIANDGWVIDDWGCRTPTGSIGSCKPVRACKPITDLVKELKKSNGVTQDVTTFLRDFACGVEGNSVKVCCPFTPLLLPKEPIVPGYPVNSDIDNNQNLNLLPQECGVVHDEDRIFGGKKTGLFEFPWMALLSYRLSKGGVDFRCGGTIINERYILTAAHCITNLRNLTLAGVRVGEHDMTTPTDCFDLYGGERICAPPIQDIGIEKVVPHPDYSNTTQENDIGLIRLAVPIDTSRNNSKPICLPTTESLRNIDLSSHTFTVTGWGLTDTFRRSFDLLQVDMPAVSEENCRKAYENTNVVITSNHICAGNKIADACRGDSGGPLQRIESVKDDLRYIQYGVVSFGPKLCGNTKSPGVYTKVNSYLPWILDTLRP